MAGVPTSLREALYVAGDSDMRYESVRRRIESYILSKRVRVPATSTSPPEAGAGPPVDDGGLAPMEVGGVKGKKGKKGNKGKGKGKNKDGKNGKDGA
eukprot:1058767-Alexandrium_andersonii.AAC.1